MGAAGRESPGGESLFLVRTRKTNEKEIAPTVCAPAPRRGGTCGARIWRGPAELASLKQLLALIRQILRSSAHTEGGERGPIPPSLRLATADDLSPHPRAGDGVKPRAMTVASAATRPGTRFPLSPLWLRRGAEGSADQGQQLFERSEFCWTPPNLSTRGCPKRKRRVADSGGGFSLVPFSCPHKRKGLAAGRLPASGVNKR